jgi:hypothetical protein
MTINNEVILENRIVFLPGNKLGPFEFIWQSKLNAFLMPNCSEPLIFETLRLM